ncbi:MAG: hypothetical protein ACTSWD_12485 [Candidatus Heimdallarchaeota archaeon]
MVKMDIKPIKISKDVLSFTDGYWEYFIHKQKPNYKITGKYLFFCKDREVLRQIAIDEIENNGFHHAKVNIEDKKQGEDYVLCLYYEDDSRKLEMAEKYKDESEVKYRYWKSDEDTLKGKYSDEFLNQLSPEERKKWTKSEKR